MLFFFVLRNKKVSTYECHTYSYLNVIYMQIMKGIKDYLQKKEAAVEKVSL